MLYFVGADYLGYDLATHEAKEAGLENGGFTGSEAGVGVFGVL